MIDDDTLRLGVFAPLCFHPAVGQRQDAEAQRRGEEAPAPKPIRIEPLGGLNLRVMTRPSDCAAAGRDIPRSESEGGPRSRRLRDRSGWETHSVRHLSEGGICRPSAADRDVPRSKEQNARNPTARLAASSTARTVLQSAGNSLIWISRNQTSPSCPAWSCRAILPDSRPGSSLISADFCPLTWTTTLRPRAVTVISFH
jgi:hypothetical protein